MVIDGVIISLRTAMQHMYQFQYLVFFWVIDFIHEMNKDMYISVSLCLLDCIATDI